MRSPVAVNTAPDAEEQQTLEDRVVEHVKQRCGHRERRRQTHSTGAKRQCEAEPDEDDPDVLDRVIGEQTLQIMLHQRVEHAEHGGDASDGKHDQARPPRRFADQIEHDPDEAIDGDFGHHSTHQRRNMAWRCRMRERQPDVQRHETGLRARSQERKEEHQGRRDKLRVMRAHQRERIAALRPCQQTERQ